MRVHAHIEKVTKEAGPEAAKELSQFQASQVHAMKRVAEKEKLDCDALLTRYLETSVSQPQADEQRKVYENQVENNLDFIGDINCVQPKYVEEISGVKGAKGGLTTTALQLWPYKFVTCLLARLIERSSNNVQTHTRVTSISQFKDGFSIASTPRGSIRAKKVVYATNGYTSGLLPEFAKKIVPFKVTCSHISTPKGSANPPPHLNHTYGLSYGPLRIRDYLIPKPDRTVICGGARNTYCTLMGRDQFGSTIAMTVPSSSLLEHILKQSCRRTSLAGKIAVHMLIICGQEVLLRVLNDYFFGYVLFIGYTADGWPHCGQVPGREKHYILAGYNVAGMPLIFLTAKGIAKMIRDDVPFESTSIPKIFKTTEEHLKKDVTS